LLRRQVWLRLWLPLRLLKWLLCLALLLWRKVWLRLRLGLRLLKRLRLGLLLR
jgi:hypothetical protein